MTPVDLVLQKLHQVPARAGSTQVIAIDGPSGSGKTTLAADLSLAHGGAPVLHMDDLYPGWDGLAAAVPRLIEWVLEPLAAQRPARYRRFDWEREVYAEWRDVPASPVLLVEGVGCGSAVCAPYISVLVWVDAPKHLRFARGMDRDGEAFRPHWTRWAAQEEALFTRERTAERADLRITTAR